MYIYAIGVSSGPTREPATQVALLILPICYAAPILYIFIFDTTASSGDDGRYLYVRP